MLLVQLPACGAGWPGRQGRCGAAPPAGCAAAGLASGHARRRLRRAEGVEPEDALDLRRHREATAGAAVLSYPVFPEESRYLEIGVEKADWTWATVPETGIDKPVAEGVPTVKPSCWRSEVTWAMVAGVGPKRWANCVGVRKWRYSGEPGRRPPAPQRPERRDPAA